MQKALAGSWPNYLPGAPVSRPALGSPLHPVQNKVLPRQDTSPSRYLLYLLHLLYRLSPFFTLVL